MPILQIDGVDYAALLEIPAFDIRLPIANNWNSQKLSDPPARFSGSVNQEPLVIGGADEAYQFGFCDKIENGTPITITDMTGAQFSYTVSQIDRSNSAQAQWLMKTDWDLTLFCRDKLTLEYIAVRCSLSYP